MTRHLFAMDNAFRNSLGEYPLETRCAVLAELGYDGVYMNVSIDSAHAWEDVERLHEVTTDYDLATTSVYTSVDLTDADAVDRSLDLLDAVDGDPLVEYALRNPTHEPSDPAGDERAERFIGRALDRAESRDLEVVLYPHFSFWLERVEDGVRLCETIDHPRLGVAFCGYHWYVVDGTASALEGRLADAAPHLRSANLCGARHRSADDGLPATIEPLDAGELDNFALLGALDRVGFDGPIGIQSYSVGGDPYTKLERSYRTFRAMERRLEERPSWTDIRFTS